MARNGISVRPYKNSKGEIVKGNWIVEVSLGVDPQTKKRIRKKQISGVRKRKLSKKGKE